MAARLGPWKAHFHTQAGYGPDSFRRTAQAPPLLYQLEHDPSERFDRSRQNGDVIERIEALVARHRASLDQPDSQLDRRE